MRNYCTNHVRTRSTKREPNSPTSLAQTRSHWYHLLIRKSLKRRSRKAPRRQSPTLRKSKTRIAEAIEIRAHFRASLPRFLGSKKRKLRNEIRKRRERVKSGVHRKLSARTHLNQIRKDARSRQAANREPAKIRTISEATRGQLNAKRSLNGRMCKEALRLARLDATGIPIARRMFEHHVVPRMLSQIRARHLVTRSDAPPTLNKVPMQLLAKHESPTMFLTQIAVRLAATELLVQMASGIQSVNEVANSPFERTIELEILAIKNQNNRKNFRMDSNLERKGGHIARTANLRDDANR